MKNKTLGEFIIDTQHDFPGSTGELSRILSSIRLAAKLVSHEVNKAGLAKHILGASGEENIQGEVQQKLDVYANELFIDSLMARGVVCGIGSEENDEFIAFNEKTSKTAKYVVLMDPLDGSSNIDVNVSIGTIFSVFERVTEIGSPVELKDFLQPGVNQVAAGYVIYGSSTMLVYSTGNGVNGFTFDPSVGVFFLSNPNMKSPENGKTYSINEGNINLCDDGVKNYIAHCQQFDPDTNRPYSARYIGSLVADFHRNLIKGGIYMYPSNSSSPNGKLRLLYECSPLAFLIEQAGGKATNGKQRIMEITPTELHQREPLFIGSSNMINELTAFIERENH